MVICEEIINNLLAQNFMLLKLVLLRPSQPRKEDIFQDSGKTII